MEKQVKVITRRWGNSIAVVIPKEIIDNQRIKEDQEIVIEIKMEKPTVGELFGKFPRLRDWSAQELKDEARRGWESDSDRERWKKK